MTTDGLAANVWSRSDLRARWKALVLLGVLAGLAAGVAIAAVDGARRTSTAIDRLATRTKASDVIVFSSQAGLWQPDWSKLAARPEVETLGRWALLFGDLNGEPGGVLFGSVDNVWPAEVDVPVLIAGRMFDPAAADEMVVDEVGAREAPVGSTISFRAAQHSKRRSALR